MILYLIRHGRTFANEQHIYCGSTDLPLLEQSISEISSARNLYPSAQEYYISGMIRTHQTLECIYGAVDYKVIPGLREIDFGEFEMHSYDELKDDPQYQAWISGDNHRNICPGGESGEQMTQRALEAFRSIVQKKQNAVIITHGGVISAIMTELFPEENKNRFTWQPAPAHGYAIEFGSKLQYRSIP